MCADLLNVLASEAQRLVNFSMSVSAGIEKWPSGSAYVFAPAFLPAVLKYGDVKVLLKNCFSANGIIDNLPLSRPASDDSAAEQKKSMKYPRNREKPVVKKVTGSGDGPLVLLDLFIVPKAFINWTKAQLIADTLLVAEWIGGFASCMSGSRSVELYEESRVDDYSDVVEKTIELEINSRGVLSVDDGEEALKEKKKGLLDAISIFIDKDSQIDKLSSPEDFTALEASKVIWDKANKDFMGNISDSDLLNVISPFFSPNRIRKLFSTLCMDFVAKDLLYEEDRSNSEGRGIISPENLFSLVEEIWQSMKDDVVKSYIRHARSSLTQKQSGGNNSNKMCELLRDARDSSFGVMWTRLQVFAKCIGKIEGRKVDSYRPIKSSSSRFNKLHTYILRTR